MICESLLRVDASGSQDQLDFERDESVEIKAVINEIRPWIYTIFTLTECGISR